MKFEVDVIKRLKVETNKREKVSRGTVFNKIKRFEEVESIYLMEFSI